MHAQEKKKNFLLWKVGNFIFIGIALDCYNFSIKKFTNLFVIDFRMPKLKNLANKAYTK